MGLFDKQIMPGNGGLLDPMLERYMQQQRRQQFWGLLSQVGQSLMSANRQGQSPLRAISAGLARGRPASGQGLGGLLDWMKVREYGREHAQEQDKASRYANLVGGLDPKTGIDWNTGRVQGQAPTTQLASSGGAPGAPGGGLLDLERRTVPGRLGFSPEQQRLLRGIGPEKGFGLLADRAFDVPDAPTVREFKEGDRIATKRWEPTTRSWVQMGEAPRYKPGGDVTTVSERLRWMLAMGKDPVTGKSVSKDTQERIARALAPGSATGPDDFEQKVYLALLRELGEHQEARDIARQARQEFFPPDAALPGAPLPPGAGIVGSAGAAGPPLASVTPIPGGLGPGQQPPYPWRKPSMEGVNLLPPASGLGTGFEGASPERLPLNALTSAQKLQRLSEQRPGKLQEPSPGFMPKTVREIESPKRPLPLTAAGKLDAKRLISGQIYEASDLTLWLWNGKNFKEVAG